MTIYRHFDDFELKNCDIDDLTIHVPYFDDFWKLKIYIKFYTLVH